MLMICGLIWGPRVNRASGTETEMPGCKIKFELRSRKKIRRKVTSRSGIAASQAKWCSFVRESFMPCGLAAETLARFAFRRGRLEGDDIALWFAIGKHMDDFDPGAFHFVHESVDARREVAVGDESRRRDDEPGGRGQQTFVNPVR